MSSLEMAEFDCFLATQWPAVRIQLSEMSEAPHMYCRSMPFGQQRAACQGHWPSLVPSPCVISGRGWAATVPQAYLLPIPVGPREQIHVCSYTRRIYRWSRGFITLNRQSVKEYVHQRVRQRKIDRERETSIIVVNKLHDVLSLAYQTCICQNIQIISIYLRPPPGRKFGREFGSKSEPNTGLSGVTPVSGGGKLIHSLAPKLDCVVLKKHNNKQFFL